MSKGRSQKTIGNTLARHLKTFNDGVGGADAILYCPTVNIIKIFGIVYLYIIRGRSIVYYFQFKRGSTLQRIFFKKETPLHVPTIASYQEGPAA